MKKIIFSLLLFTIQTFTLEIYLPPGSCMTVPLGANICTDTVTVDVGACFIAGDSSCICPGIVFRGGGTIIISVTQISTSVPSSFSLYQNFPNPFNPNTRMRFDVAKQELVRFTVYDALGREVNTLVNAKLQPGSYEVDFDAVRYPSGIYFYKLETESFTDSRKMILVK